ncbi:MAG TPA: response regulator [Bacteroidales bacterium]|nr:response regulator [Bacteroidales bacterium]
MGNIEPEKFHGKKILVVEDDPVSTEFLKEVLTALKMKMLHSSSGEEAVRLCADDHSIDMVLMDIRLTGIDGYQATREIKSSNPRLPVVAQTAYALQGDKEKAIEAGCDAYISKPIRISKLMEIFNNIFYP